MLETFRTARGIVRSLRIYYGDRPRRRAMAEFYGTFVSRGDLVFDIGAHVGDRIAAFRSLGARVVALEPQPALVKTLRVLYGRDRDVTIVPHAVGAEEGEIELMLNVDNPTVSTASADFRQAANGAPGWEGQRWTKSVCVPMVTLDRLVRDHGAPRFIKIDVEGFEAQALAGLSKPVPTLSFEFTTIQRSVAADCIARCAVLGYTRFNAALGESQRFALSDWRSAGDIEAWLMALPASANSGDIYARLA